MRNFKTGCVGFTVVEMLVVVVLIALLASVSGGFYAGTYKRAVVRKSARDFLLAAKYARVLAIERQKKCSIKIDLVNHGFMLVVERYNDQSGESEQAAVRDLFFKPIQFGGDVKFERVQIKAADFQSSEDEQGMIKFLPDGTAEAAVIQIGDGRNHLTVSISASTGKAKVFSGMAEDVKKSTIDLDEEQR